MNMCKTVHNNMTFTTVEKKKGKGIPYGIPEIRCLKQPILSILSILQLLNNLKQQILLQTTVNMCKSGNNNMTFTTVEKKIAYNTLRYT